jgi:hypothetical protein
MNMRESKVEKMKSDKSIKVNQCCSKTKPWKNIETESTGIQEAQSDKVHEMKEGVRRDLATLVEYRPAISCTEVLRLDLFGVSPIRSPFALASR